MLTRRDFHARLVASLAAMTMPSVVQSSETDFADLDGLWLNRLTYGASPADRDAIRTLGRARWLDAQLEMPVSDAGLDAALARARLRINYEAESDENGNAWTALDELRPLSSLTSSPDARVGLIDWSKGMAYAERSRPAEEVVAATLIRAVHAPAQLREVMTGFWHDHFNVNAQKSEYTAAFFPDHDRLLRDHALGNFRALLGAVATSPSMLYYLNNDESRASPANENYARELLELHTLGAAAYLNDRHSTWSDVPGARDGLSEGYIDQDVYEVARAFTGWSVGDGRWVAEGEEAPRDGRFHYVASWHDPYQKRILGREFAPQRGPLEDGQEVLDMLARHPATARHVTTKLARRFLTDTPDPALVDRLVAVFLEATAAPDQIAQVLRALILDPAFDATPPSKLRRPFEFLVAQFRASGAEVSATENAAHWQLSRAGWQMHSYGPPTGHPDHAGAWSGASTLSRLVDFALYAHDDWFGVTKMDLSPVLPGETAGAFVQRHAGSLAPRRSAEVLAALTEPFGLDPAADPAPWSADDRRGLAVSARALAALTPDMLLR